MGLNSRDRAKILEHLTRAVETAIEEIIEGEGVVLPPLGLASTHHMSIAALNVLEAIDDVGQYLVEQLDDETRESLGL